jgi:UDP-N-acetylmuramate: L-alanyl-gamma-D-glutamyl-meso-diaminopimelate ligase
MDEADIAVVFYSPHTLSIKKLPPVDPQQIADAFVNRNISVFDNNEAITSFLQSLEVNDSVCLMMSSGNWNGVNVFEILKEKMES